MHKDRLCHATIGHSVSFGAVARFYFHLHNDVEALDEEGTELADLDAARLYAQKLVRFEAGESVKINGRLVPSHRIDIEDGHGRVLDTVRFGEVVTVES